MHTLGSRKLRSPSQCLKREGVLRLRGMRTTYPLISSAPERQFQPQITHFVPPFYAGIKRIGTGRKSKLL